MSNDEVVVIPKVLMKDTMDFINSLDHQLARIVSVKLRLPTDLAV